MTLAPEPVTMKCPTCKGPMCEDIAFPWPMACDGLSIEAIATALVCPHCGKGSELIGLDALMKCEQQMASALLARGPLSPEAFQYVRKAMELSYLMFVKSFGDDGVTTYQRVKAWENGTEPIPEYAHSHLRELWDTHFPKAP